MASLESHGTCAYSAPSAPVPAENRFDGTWLQQMQWQMQRRQLDADGVPGAEGDYWYPYSAQNSYNYADFSSWNVESVDPENKQLTLVKQGGGDPRTVTLFSWREPRLSGRGYTSGFVRTGTVQAGDVIQFSANSVLTYTCWPVVTRVVGYDIANSKMVVECDKAATAALTKYQIKNPETNEYEDDPNLVTCKVYQHAANAPTWRNILKPDYFHGKRTTKPVALSEVPTNGVLQLAEVAVMHPGGFDPLSATWVFEGKRIDNAQWESVPQANQRLFCQPAKAYVSFKTEKPAEGLASLTLSDDLTTTYSSFRLTYYSQVGPEATSCDAVGYARCRHSVPLPPGSDYNQSVGAGGGYVCLKRLIDVHTHEPDDYQTEHSSVTASGVTRYPATGGLCQQYNCCDMWEAAESGGGTAPFAMSRDGANAIRELVGSANQRLERIIPRYPGFGAWQAQRIGHPSLAWHAGYVGIQNPVVIDSRDAVFRGYGLWGTPYVYETTETVGEETITHQHLGTIQGAYDGFKTDAPTSDPAGNFAGLGLSFTSTRDPIEAGNSTYIQRELERVGAAVEKDSGELQSRGLSQSTIAVAPQDIIIPNVSTTAEGEQKRSNGSFIKNTGMPSVVKLMPLRQEAKSGTVLGSRTVSSVGDLGSGRWSIELENGQHIYSFINDGPEIGDSFDQLISFNGGGIWPIMPKPHQQIVGYYEPNKFTGSRACGAWRGDSITCGVVGDIRHFIIDSVTPYGGSEAPDWGSTRYETFNYTSQYLWTPNPANLAMGTTPETYGNMVEVTCSIGGTPLTLIDDNERPATITDNHFWTDGAFAYFSPADKLQWVEIKYYVDDGKGNLSAQKTENFYIPESIVMPTMIPVGNYSSAYEIVVEIEGVAASNGTGVGQYQVDLGGTHAVYTLNITDANKAVTVRFAYAELAPAPEDYYCIGGNYTSFGKKRDVVVVLDDTGYVGDLSPGDTITFYTCEAVALPGFTIEWTAFGTDNWLPVEGVEIQAGNGYALIPETWFADKPANVCLKLVGVEWLDHRGIVPASLVNKIQAAVDSLDTVTTYMGGNRSGSYTYSKAIEQAWYLGCKILPDGSHDCSAPLEAGLVNGPFNFTPTMGNRLGIQAGGMGGETDYQAASLAFSSSSTGAPFVLSFIPDDCTITDAQAEVFSSGITRSVQTFITVYDCEGEKSPTPNPPDTKLEGLEYAFIAFTSPDDFDVIGTVAASTPNAREVVNITSIIQKMYAERSTGKYPYGYGIIAGPEGGAPGAGVEAYFPSGEPGYASYGPCPGYDFPSFYFTNRINTIITWGNLSFGKITITFQYPNGEKVRIVWFYRLPDMGDPA